MFGLLIGWGVFWLLIWTAVMVLFWNERGDRSGDALGISIVGMFVSLAWIVAVLIGHAIGG